MSIHDGKVGANAHYLIQSAVNSHGLGNLDKNSPETLLRYYIEHDMLPKNAGVAQALALKKQRTAQEMADFHSLRVKFSESVCNTKERLQKACACRTPNELLEALGIETEILLDGKKRLSSYGWNLPKYSFQIAGVDEKKLIEGVEEISGKCSLTGSYLKNLGSIKRINELIIPYFTQIEDLSGLKHVNSIAIEGAEDLGIDELKAFLKKLKLSPEVIERARIFQKMF